MRALSLTQPWASLIGRGKKHETRSWATRYRGPVAIQASQRFPRECIELALTEPFRSALAQGGYTTLGDLPRGAIVAVATLIWCHRVELLWSFGVHVAEPELSFGDYTPGRYAWGLEHIHTLPEPIPCKGSLGLWQVPDDIAARLRQATS